MGRTAGCGDSGKNGYQCAHNPRVVVVVVVGHGERRRQQSLGGYLYFEARGRVAHARELRDALGAPTGTASIGWVGKYVGELEGVPYASGSLGSRY